MYLLINLTLSVLCSLWTDADSWSPIHRRCLQICGPLQFNFCFVSVDIWSYVYFTYNMLLSDGPVHRALWCCVCINGSSVYADRRLMTWDWGIRGKLGYVGIKEDMTLPGPYLWPYQSREDVQIGEGWSWFTGKYPLKQCMCNVHCMCKYCQP